jgi:hypothetical protein
MIKHTIRPKDGGTRTVSLSPLEAIRLNCLECVCWSEYEVIHCTSKRCSLYPFRFGEDLEHKGKEDINNFNEKWGNLLKLFALEMLNSSLEGYNNE